MPDILRTITTSTDPQRVWDYLSDFTTTEEWDPLIRSAVRERGDGGVGTVYRNISRILGQELEIEFTVVEHVAPYLLQLRGSTAVMEVVDTIVVEPEGAGTAVTYHAEFSPQGAARLALPLLPLVLKNLGDDAAESMEERLLYL